MSKYERSGKVRVPEWWLAKVLPLLDHPSVKLADVARAASRHAGRTSPWKTDAISKFATGTVRTIELTNGISAALGVVQPFFTAPTEAAASAMSLIAQDTHVANVEQHKKLSAFDRVAAREIESVDVDQGRNAAVASPDHGSKVGRGGRTRRAARSRS